MDLPTEIRDRNYFWTIRPDCGLGVIRCGKNHEHLHSGIGTTKILCLSRKIYREVIGLIFAHEQPLVLRGDGGAMLRNMFAFGKPGLFCGRVPTSQCSVPQQYCQLNMVGLKYLALTFKYPLPGHGQYVHPQTGELVDVPRSNDYEKRMEGLLKSARETEAVLCKCRSLQTLRLVFQTDQTCFKAHYYSWGEEREHFAVNEETHTEVAEVVGIFLNAAKCKKFQTAAEEDQRYLIRHSETHVEKSYLSEYNMRAEQLGIRANFDQTWENSYVKFQYEVDVPRKCSYRWFRATREPGAIFEGMVEEPVHSESSVGIQDDTSDQEEALANDLNAVEAAPMPPSPRLKSSPALKEDPEDLPPLPACTVESEGPVRRRLKVYVNKDAEPPQLSPECRKCFELFASFEGLHHHLQEFPKHRISFKRKAYNTLACHAQHGGHRKCWTCAKSYVSLEFLRKHLDQCGHRREGMIPRWKQDNAWTDRRDGKRKARREEQRREKSEREYQGLDQQLAEEDA